MTDPIREAFDEWASANPPFSPIEIWQAAWKQSRREALMEAAEICDERIARNATNPYNQGQADCAYDLAEAIRAAAEENGRE